MQSDGIYEKTPAPEGDMGCQQAMIDIAERRLHEANKLRKRRSKGFARRVVQKQNGRPEA
jgi:hypothetical protein